MIILLLLIGATALLYATVWICRNFDKWEWRQQRGMYNFLDCVSVCESLFQSAGFILAVITAICVICIIVSNAQCDRLVVENAARRDALMARIESGYCGYDECVIDEVARFNRDIRKNKYNLESPWTSWFTVNEYAGIEPIDMQLAVNSAHKGHYIKQDMPE